MARQFADRSSLPLSLIVLDMGSTWEPFLEYVDASKFEVIRFSQGLGPRDLWTLGYLKEIGHGPFFLSDGDLDYTSLSNDGFQKLVEVSDRYPWFPKVGLSLKIDDLPQDVEGHRIKRWDYDNMKVRLDSDCYISSVDTTAAFYRNRTTDFYYRPALRLNRNYEVRHYPWYERPENLDQEAKTYYSLAVSNISTGIIKNQVTFKVKVKRRLIVLSFIVLKPFLRSPKLGPTCTKILKKRHLPVAQGT